MDRQIRIYQCDNTVEGILSAVYDAGISGYGHDYIRIQPQSDGYFYSMELFAEYISVDTSDEKVKKVLKAIVAKISMEAYSYVMKAIISNDADRADVIYQFVAYGFTIGSGITQALQLPCVTRIFKIVRNVQNEIHRFVEILRFKEVQHEPALLLAVMEPNNAILPMVTEHFADRFNPEWFIIHDVHHHTASFHSPSGEWEVRILTESEEKKLIELNDNDEDYADLWKVFFDSVAVEERINFNLQRGNIPKYLRKYMTEFTR